MLEFEKFKINHKLVPDSIYYIPNFLESSDEEQQLIDQVLAAPKPKWTYLSNRSLQNWGGLPHPKGMVQEPMPEWLEKYLERLDSMQIFDGKRPNHVLMNRYLPGQGIMAHEDGPLFYPTVATINTGSHTVLNFYRKTNLSEVSSCIGDDGDKSSKKPNFSLLLLPKSLLILKHEAYTGYLHEIEPLKMDRIQTGSIVNLDLDTIRLLLDPTKRTEIENSDTIELERSIRYSFTIRHVPKVLKIDLKNLLFKK